jgi:DNA polymerase III sliding clamp (beta) subunit (PCNA family)
MKTERTKLLAALDIVKPAIAAKALLEELTHVWFLDKRLIAYDDVIGISAPFDAEEIQGGIKGQLIVGLLNASGAKNVELTAKGDEALLKAARAKLNLALLEPERAVWDFPKVKNNAFSPLSKELLAGLADVLIAVGQDTSIPDQLGVTFQLAEDGLTLFTTDSKTIAQCFVPAPKGFDEEYMVVPTQFCEQLLRLGNDKTQVALIKGGIVANCESGVGIYSRLVDVPDPSDFTDTLQRALPKNYNSVAVPIPGNMRLAIERALVVLNGKVAEPISMTVKDGILNLECRSDLGELHDEIELDGKHEDASLQIDPTLIKRALDKCDSMLLADSCFAMIGRKGNFVYVISSIER